MKKILALILALCVMCAMFTGCGKDKDKDSDSNPTNVETQAPEDTSGEGETEGKEEVKEEPEVKEADYKLYNNTLLGINFEHDKRLFSEEHTADVLNAIADFTKSGAKFDIHRNQIGGSLNLVTLLAKDKINTTIGVAIAPYITAEDVKKAEDPVASATPASDTELEAIREIVIDDAFASSMSDGIKKGLTTAKKTLIGEIVTEVVTFDIPVDETVKVEGETPAEGETHAEGETPSEGETATVEPEKKTFNAVVMEYTYEGLKGKYSVVHVAIPCGKNMINIVASSEEGKSDFDKYEIVTHIASSIKMGVEYVVVQGEDTIAETNELIVPEVTEEAKQPEEATTSAE